MVLYIPINQIFYLNILFDCSIIHFMIFPQIIGISGYARVGKDSFGKMLSQELSVEYNKYSKRLSLAYELKKDLDTFLLKKFNISAFTENSEEKKFIRPLLICYGTTLMRKKDPDCWIDKLQKTIDINNSSDIISLVCDIRFENEADWIHRNNGILINLERSGTEPADENENFNGPILKSKSDLNVDWEHVENLHSLKPKVKQILKTILK